MSEKPSVKEIVSRIQDDIASHHGSLPQPLALVWSGYLAALIEWGLISISEHEMMMNMLPQVKNNPAVGILLGKQDQS